MSTNLHLTNAGGASCALLQTPTEITGRVYRPGDNRYAVLLRYFDWAATRLSDGALLDHKLEVALFLVQHPDAEWGAW